MSFLWREVEERPLIRVCGVIHLQLFSGRVYIGTMTKRSRKKMQGLVEHPRYGAEVRDSGDVEGAKLAQQHYMRWRGPQEEMFWASAIRADLKKQKYLVMPQLWYVDTLKYCRDCKRGFLFFAEEQQYWYEELGFIIYADCVRCPDCRKTERTLRRRFNEYSLLAAKKELSNDEMASLVMNACFLWEEGILNDPMKLYRLRKLALRRLSGSKAAKAIDKICERLKNEEGKSGKD